MSRSFYRPELNAFAFVFFCHTCSSIRIDMSHAGPIQAFLANLSRVGAYGVDIFSLSAYLITTLLISERQNEGTINTVARKKGFKDMASVFRISDYYFGSKLVYVRPVS
jgi:hypothetical protein